VNEGLEEQPCSWRAAASPSTQFGDVITLPIIHTFYNCYKNILLIDFGNLDTCFCSVVKGKLVPLCNYLPVSPLRKLVLIGVFWYINHASAFELEFRRSQVLNEGRLDISAPGVPAGL